MYTRFHLSTEALPETTRVVRVSGTEGVNQLPEWKVRILCPDGPVNVDDLLCAPVTLEITDEAEESMRLIELVAFDVAFEGKGHDGAHYELTLSAPVAQLKLRSGFKTFLDKKVDEIVKQVLTDAGTPDDRLVFRLSGKGYEKRPYCVQYGESEWNFITRLLADEGISYWFDFDDSKGGTLVFGDSTGAHDGITPPTVIPYDDAGGQVRARSFFELTIDESIAPTSTHLRELDVRNPDVYIEGKAGSGALSYFEYPACVMGGQAATERAAVRLDQLQRFQKRAVGRADNVRIAPGRVLDIEGAADAWVNRRYLVVQVEHTFSEGSRNDSGDARYENRVTMVPADDRAFRPAADFIRPKMEGVEPAVTTGPSGEEIHVDDLGRVKVRFLWDLTGAHDDKSSYWVRTTQINMAGAMLLPRVGWEVPIAYIDGNPDRPFVLGRTYNATAIVPYGLPGGSATTTLQSATSPGGGTTNELRMGDSGGGQEMFLHATKDQTVVVGGSAKSNISSNETHDVTLTLKLGIGGSQSLTVSASQTVDVGTDMTVIVKGGRSETVGALEQIKVTGNRTVAADGAYNELIGAAYGIQCNQSNTKVDGAFTQLVGGTMSLTGGLGFSASVAAAHTEAVGGSRSITCLGGYGDTVRGVKAVTAGPTKEKAGGPVSTQGKATGSVTVGGSANWKASDVLVLEAPTITIDVAGSLKAGALKLAGGTLKATKGTTKLKGNITRKSGTKVG